jgi:hypothetical protein
VKGLAIAVITTFILITILVSCIVVKDSKIDGSYLFREDVNGDKETGLDFEADCNQQIGGKCSDDKE